MGRPRAIRPRMIALSKLAAAKREYGASTNEEIETPAIEVAPVTKAPELPAIVKDPNELNLSWTQKGQQESQKYKRSMFGYSARHNRRLKQQNKQAAKGSLKIDSMFAPVATVDPPAPTDPMVKEDSLTPSQFKKKAEEAVNILCDFTMPVINRKSVQQQLGYAQMAKYNAVYFYLNAIVNSGLKKMDASKYASDLVYKSGSSSYTARNIRRYADEYLKYGRISLVDGENMDETS